MVTIFLAEKFSFFLSLTHILHTHKKRQTDRQTEIEIESVSTQMCPVESEL